MAMREMHAKFKNIEQYDTVRSGNFAKEPQRLFYTMDEKISRWLHEEDPDDENIPTIRDLGSDDERDRIMEDYRAESPEADTVPSPEARALSPSEADMDILPPPEARAETPVEANADNCDDFDLGDEVPLANYRSGNFVRVLSVPSRLLGQNGEERRENDRLGPIRQVFDDIVKVSSELYSPSDCCKLDEMLLGFRGRCVFKMYIPSKPDEYGIKIVMLCDSKTAYMINAFVYLGKDSTPRNVPCAEFFTMKLTEPIHGSNRNLTCFTSIPVANQLLQKQVTMQLIPTPNFAVVKQKKPRRKAINYKARIVTKDLFTDIDKKRIKKGTATEQKKRKQNE
ncbi:unnamed protein product [Colias eurytheme]|nr:unnamed protein product [Colias eurytheme]